MPHQVQYKNKDYFEFSVKQSCPMGVEELSINHYYALGLNTIVFFSHAYLHFHSLTKNKTFRKKLLFILRGTMCF